MSSVTLVNYVERSSFGTRRIPHRAFVYIMKPRVRDQKSKRQVPGVQSDTTDAAVSKWHSFGRSGSFLRKFGAQGGPRVPKCEEKSVDLQKSEKNQIQRRFLQPNCVCKTATPCVYFEP